MSCGERKVMREVLLLLALFALAFSGFALFAGSQKKHGQRLTGREGAPSHPRARRQLGGLFCLAALAWALLRDGPSFGAILWVLTLSVSAFAVAMVLAGRPACLRVFK